VDDLTAGDEGLHRRGVPDDSRGAIAHRIGLLVHHDAPLVDHDHMFEKIGHLVDQVAGQDDGARMLDIVLQEPVVEDLPRDRIQAQIGLVEEGDLRA